MVLRENYKIKRYRITLEKLGKITTIQSVAKVHKSQNIGIRCFTVFLASFFASWKKISKFKFLEWWLK
jgi:hypothetical protein